MVEKLHPKVILTFCFLFECTLFPRKRGCSRLKKGRHQRQRQVRLKTCSTGGVRQDVRCYMCADVHCRGFGWIPAQKNLFGKQIFSLFSAEKLPYAKSKEFCQKRLSQPGDGFFLECRAENISGEAFCEGKQTRNLLNGSIQILDGIMRQFCEFMNLWVESTNKKNTSATE